MAEMPTKLSGRPTHHLHTLAAGSSCNWTTTKEKEIFTYTCADTNERR